MYETVAIIARYLDVRFSFSIGVHLRFEMNKNRDLCITQFRSHNLGTPLVIALRGQPSGDLKVHLVDDCILIKLKVSNTNEILPCRSPLTNCKASTHCYASRSTQ